MELFIKLIHWYVKVVLFMHCSYILYNNVYLECVEYISNVTGLTHLK